MIYRNIIFALIVWSLHPDELLGSSSLGHGVAASTLPPSNFSCYQCAVTSMHEKCGPEALKPCLHTSDRCVTHITRSSSSSLLVRRECGLGPCAFESENSDATAVLGMDPDHCDITRPEVFCILCCRGSGCNTAPTMSTPSAALLVTIVLALLCRPLR